MKNLYREGIDVLGDATADTGMYTSALTELIKTGTTVAQTKQASDAAAKSSAAAAAAAKPAAEAKKAADEANKRAAFLQAEAEAAAAKSAAMPNDAARKDAAKLAALKAADAAAEAKAATAKAAYFGVVASGGKPTAEQEAAMRAALEQRGESSSAWKWALGIGAGVVTLGGGAWLILRKKGKR